jgi:hypothetical protein
MALTTVADVSEDALNLKNMMDGILSRIEDVFQTYNVPLPQRRYWTMGEVAVDCEQVVVNFLQMYLGTPGDEQSMPQRCHVPRTATVIISISRAVATVGQNGRPPSGDKITESAHASAIDAWVLMECIRQFDMWDDTGYGLGVIATMDSSGPEGGFQTVNMQLTLAVP